jgi:endonuclease/exonuclease/phosphatase family metal-dependent hydrolase
MGDGRDPDHATSRLFSFVHRERLDFLALQEIVAYRPEIAATAEARDMTLVVFTENGRPQADEGILVAKGIDVTHARSLTLSTDPDATPHGPMFAPTAVLDEWLRVVSIHYPPGVHAPAGPRARARVRSSRRLASFARWHPALPLAYVGDWNQGPDELTPGSPRTLARTIRGTIAAGNVGTHGRRSHPPIDYAIVRGADVDDLETHTGLGSDHAAVTFLIRDAR